MGVAALTEAVITGGTTAEDITEDITAAGTMVDTAAAITVAGVAAITADIGAVHGGRGGDSLAQRAQRYTTVPLLRTTGIRLMGIHTMRIHHRPSTHTTLRQHLQPSATLQRLTKVEG